MPLGTTGSAVAMPLLAERNRHTDTTERGQDGGNKGETTRKRERMRGWGRKKDGRKYCKEKRSRRNPFLREKDTYMSSVSFPRLIQHTKLIAGDIRGK